jgi:single-stranded DNA-binding protein
MGFNRVMLIGRATQQGTDQVRDGRRGIEFPLVIERTIRNTDGPERTVKTEVPVIAFGNLADTCRTKLPVAEKDIYVEGRLKVNSWKTEDGKWHYSGYVVADRCEVDGASLAMPPPRVPEPERAMAGAAA